MTHHSLSKRVFALVIMLSMLLQAFPAQAKTVTTDNTYRFYMVGNSHIDTAWRWPIQHTAEEIIRDTFDRQITALQSNEGFKFTSSCSIHYKWTKEYYPEMYKEILELFDKGQWGIAGGQYVEPDLNVMEGETFARQGLYAQHFFLEEFGRIAYVNLVPDVFGFSGQFPQFIRKTGMTGYVATKMNWNSQPNDGALDPGPWSQSNGNGTARAGRESDIFWWEGVDGSDVLSYNCKYDYTSSYSTTDFRGSGTDTVFNRLARSGSLTSVSPYSGTYYYDYDSNIKYALGMYGSGDHGGGPTTISTGANHGFPAANTGTSSNSNTRVISATLDDYFDAVRAPGVGTFNEDGANREEALMDEPYNNTSLDRVYRHAGENYFRNHRGTYTSWSRVKKDNRQLNNLSQTAEQAATLGFWTNSLAHNSNEKIEASWERISVNTMHDILPGSSGPIQYYQTFMNYELCRNLLTNVQNNSLVALAHRADTTVDVGVPVFVYNPSSWQRDGETETKITLDKGYDYIKVLDGDTELPATVIENNTDGTAKISFIAKAVPSLGYKVFKVVGSDTPSALAKTVSVTENADSFVVENENLRFTINKTTGNMPSLINKQDGDRETFYQGARTYSASSTYAAFEGNALQHKADQVSESTYPAWDLTTSDFSGLSQYWETVNTVAETPTIVENTPEKVTIKVVQKITGGATNTSDGIEKSSGDSTFVRYITLLAGGDKVDVHFDLDWQYARRMLKVAFPVNADARGSSYEIAYGAMDGALEVDRINEPITYGTSAAPVMSNSIAGTPAFAGALGRNTIRDTLWNSTRFEQSGHKWMDITADDKSSGMSLLNDAKYGFDVLKFTYGANASGANGMGTDPGIPANGTYVRTRMSVVRSPRSANNDYQRANQVANPTRTLVDIGEQNFNYSIYPHAGTWQDANTSVKAHEVNFPMQSFQATPSKGDGILGKENSFFSLNKDNVIIGAVKNQHDEQTNKNKIIVRVWETNGADTKGVVLKLPSNVIKAREVNMLEHDYDELSEDNIDAPISTELIAKPITIDGDTVSFDIGHYEILTMEFVIAPYAGAQLKLDQEQVSLASAFNIRGTSPDSDRSLGNLDGAGNTIPEPLWKEAREAGVDYQGIKFQLGPDAANNFVEASSEQPISLNNATGYNRVYLLGLAGRGALAGGTFTVNYADGSSQDKWIKFADWRSPLTGWVPMDRMDTKPYVYDSIAQVFSHWHSPTIDMMTIDNYMYVYYIDVDDTKMLESISLPDAAGAKLAAITLINSEIDGFGSTDEGKNVSGTGEYYWDFSDLSTGATGSNVDKLHIYSSTSVPKAWATLLDGPGGAGGTVGTGEGPQNTVLNDGATKYCGNISTANNWFIYDAGEPIRETSYVIRGANDDNNYATRIPSGWIVEGATSASGPWTTIDTQTSQTTGTANYNVRTYTLAWPTDSPAEGYQYYKLTITHTRTGTSSQAAIGTSTTLIQFSFFGFFPDVRWQNGNLVATVADNSVSTVGGKFNANSLNGTKIVTLSGKVADDQTAPIAAKNSTLVKSGLNIEVFPDSKFYYAFKPSNEASAYMTLDIKFDDEGRLKDTDTKDVNGIGMNPIAQGSSGNLVIGEWNYVEVDLGKFAAGRFVSQIILAYETKTGTPGQEIEGSFDNVAIFRGDGDFGDVNVYAALYNVEGRLVSLSATDPLSLHAFSAVILDSPIVVDMSPAGPASFVKLFVWTSDEYLPVTTEPESFELMPGTSSSTAENAEIIYSAADANNAKFEVTYAYDNPDGIPEGATRFKWFKNVGGTYSLITGATGKTVNLSNTEVRGMDGIRCEITVFDSNWDQGSTVTVDLTTANTNLLLGAAVKSQTTANNTASNMVDGNLATKWDAPTESSYSGYQGSLPHIAIFELSGGVKNISQIQVWHASSNPSAVDYDKDERIPTYDFDVSYSSDNVTWTNAESLNWKTVEIRKNTEAITVINLGESVPVRYVRITVITPNAGGDDWDTAYKSVRILELQANASIVD